MTLSARAGGERRASSRPGHWGVCHDTIGRIVTGGLSVKMTFISWQEGGLTAGGEPRYKFCIVAKGAALCRDITRDIAAIRRKRRHDLAQEECDMAPCPTTRRATQRIAGALRHGAYAPRHCRCTHVTQPRYDLGGGHDTTQRVP